MSASPITQSTRYWRQGTSKVIFCPTVAAISAPTRSEINAGTDLSPEISAVNGWEVTSNTADAPDLATTFVGKVPSDTTAGDSSLTFYSDSASVDVRSLLSRGVTGYILWMDEGDVAGHKMDVFPVTVTSAPKQRDIQAVATIMISFAVTREPSENVAVPA